MEWLSDYRTEGTEQSRIHSENQHLKIEMCLEIPKKRRTRALSLPRDFWGEMVAKSLKMQTKAWLKEKKEANRNKGKSLATPNQQTDGPLKSKAGLKT